MDPIFIYSIIIMVGTPTSLFLYEEGLILGASALIGQMVFCFIMALVTYADRRRRENERIRKANKKTAGKRRKNNQPGVVA